MKLGQLKRLDLRKVWEHEEQQFTPWLAQHIDLLAETLGLGDDLEVASTEETIGRYRADIVCTSTAGKVVVENQLGSTDHSHLGQILAYAAGVEASTVVWVAASFTDEHRAALDWLNSVTEGVEFFGLEIELWKIGNSDPAPKFNVVSKPNDWSRTVAAQSTEALTPTKQLQLEYWTAFRDVLVSAEGPARPTKPLPQHWMNVSAGRGGFKFAAIADTRTPEIRTELYIDIQGAQGYFESLRQERQVIEKELGFRFDWQPLHGRKACRLVVTKGFDPKDKSTWPEQHQWLARHVNRMHEVLTPRVRTLEPAENEGDGTS